MAAASLHWSDYVVFSVYLVISLAIGIYFACSGGGQRTTKEFISGSNSLPLVPTTLSLAATYVSAIFILGMTAEVYWFGIQAWVMTFLSFTISAVLAERLLVPWMYRQNITSVFEYLDIRFQSKSVKMLGVSLGLLFMVLYMGASLYAPAIALEAVSGFPVSATISAMAIVCTLYTALGGMKAVVYTDVFQAFILLAGCVAICIRAMDLSGGAQNAFATARQHRRLEWIDTSIDPTVRHTVWGLLFGLSWSFWQAFSLSQPAVQRYKALPTLAKARQVILLNIIPLCIINLIIGLAGVAVFSYYALQRCDPLVSGKLQSPNQVLPYFVLNSFEAYPGMTGMFMAALFSGAMSSVSSSLSSAAAVAWRDIIRPVWPAISDTRGALLNKLLVIIFSAMSIGVAFLAATIPAIPINQTTTTFLSITTGPLGGVFLLGGLSKRANWKSALIGCLSGVVFIIWVGVGAMTSPQQPPTLPPPAIDGCSDPQMHNYTHYTTISAIGADVHDYDMTTSATDLENTTIAVQQTVQRSYLHTLYSLSYTWYALFSAIITIAVGYLSSLCFKDNRTFTPKHNHTDNLMIDLSLDALLQSPLAKDESSDFNCNDHEFEKEPLSVLNEDFKSKSAR